MRTGLATLGPFGAHHRERIGLRLQFVLELDHFLGLVERRIFDRIGVKRRADQHQNRDDIEDAQHVSGPPVDAAGGASVRSAQRNLAERARGLRSAFGVGRRDRLGGLQGEGRRRRRLLAGQQARDGAAAPGAPGEEMLDDAVFQRMEGDDSEPPARPQQALGRLQRAGQLVELLVHRDAQRLEGAGRRMDVLRLAADWRGR